MRDIFQALKDIQIRCKRRQSNQSQETMPESTTPDTSQEVKDAAKKHAKLFLLAPDERKARFWELPPDERAIVEQVNIADLPKEDYEA